MSAAAPLLSIVVTVVDGGAALRRCVHALLSQDAAPPLEILVPYDATASDVPAIVHDVSGPNGADRVRCLDLGRLETRRPPHTFGGQHELFDRRRAAGLAAARGDLVAIVEDRGVPRADWAATIARLHGTLPNLVIGGAVENAADRPLNWAVYYCDFGRYQRPFPAGPRDTVSDVNVAYKRRALDETRAIWQSRFHEPWVHGALQQNGEALFGSPDLIVDQVRDDLALPALIRERLGWGRLFGALRDRDASLAGRLVRVAVSPVVPLVLFVRLLRERLVRQSPLGPFVRAAPATLVLLTAWAAGEAIGALTAEP